MCLFMPVYHNRILEPANETHVYVALIVVVMSGNTDVCPRGGGYSFLPQLCVVLMSLVGYPL